MTRIKKNYYLFSAFMIVFGIIGILIGSFYDLQISRTIYVKNEIFSSLIEAVCFFPIYMPAILLFILLTEKTNKLFLKAIFTVISIIGNVIMLYVGLHYLEKREMVIVPSYLSIPALTLLSVAVFLYVTRLLKNASEETLKKLMYFSIIGSIYLLWELLFAQSLKFLAGRPRFEEILNDSSLYFADWYNFTRQGGSSFPSGHTAQSCAIFLILFLPLLFRKYEKKTPVFMFSSALYVIVTALSRIILGKHFLSDVSFSLFFMGCGLFLLFRYHFRHSEKGSDMCITVE